MDISEYTRIAFDRIYKIEPEHVTKIIGYILLHDQGYQKIVQLAEAPDHELHNIVSKATTDLQLQRSAAKPCTMMSPHVLTQAIGFHGAERILYDEDMKWTADYLNYTKGLLDSPIAVEPMMKASYFTSDYSHGDKRADIQYYSRGRREFPVKTCHYFNKGFCKHGMNCRYYHGQVNGGSWYHQFYGNGNGNDGVNDGHDFSPGSLAELEADIVELLRSRNGDPLSITSLPIVYYERYKKVLRVNGYSNENQRYGKTGFSLTKLLARLKNSICVIDRPHGHAVILAEYAQKYLKYQSHERVDRSQNASASRQIYLTFPADSTFTEEDVSDYFNTFGCVEDVRIPCQLKRMFGFVTFVNADTVKAILEKGNPHTVGGARVLVKPYREKTKLSERKFRERIEQSIEYSPRYIDHLLHRNLTPMPRQDESPILFLRKDGMNDQEQALEYEMRQLAILQLTQRTPSSQSHLGYSQDGLRSFFEEHLSSGVDDKQRDEDANNTDQDSCNQILNLPDSPFSMSSIEYSHMVEDYRY